jgi:septum formation protein
MSDTKQTNPLSQQSLPSPLILGSSSFTRKLILREMGIPFHILVRSIDEKAIGDRTKDPHELVLAVARAKMAKLIESFKTGDCNGELPTTDWNGEHVILTGDQVITCDDTILEKPSDVKEAKAFVKMYASHPPSTVGSVILSHYPSGITVEGTDKATIYFKESVGDVDATTNLDLVDRMLQEGAPILSCAGGLMIEHPMVREHVERIDGTEDSVMGLSKDLVERLLRELRSKLLLDGR